MNPESATTRPRRSRRRLVMWGVALIVVVTVGVGAVFGSQLGHDPTLVDSPLIGQPAPGVTLPNLGSSGSVSLSELRGGVVVVNFWASWCVACRAEHPALTAAARDYAGAGVVAETDIGSGQMEVFIHWPGNDGSAQSTASKKLDITQWHNYAVERSSSAVTGWIDGEQWFRFTNSQVLRVPGPMHPTIQLDCFDPKAKMQPANHDVMWFRMYAPPK